MKPASATELYQHIRELPHQELAQWQPQQCSDIDIRIARDGRWYYQGTLISRTPISQVFASILRRENDEYFLVTPMEKLRIAVDDAPFIATDFEITGSGATTEIDFFTNLHHRVPLGAEFSLALYKSPLTHEPAPYLQLPRRLTALLTRATYYRLAEHAMTQNDQPGAPYGIWSRGLFFCLQ